MNVLLVLVVFFLNVGSFFIRLIVQLLGNFFNEISQLFI